MIEGYYICFVKNDNVFSFYSPENFWKGFFGGYIGSAKRFETFKEAVDELNTLKPKIKSNPFFMRDYDKDIDNITIYKNIATNNHRFLKPCTDEFIKLTINII